MLDFSFHKLKSLISALKAQGYEILRFSQYWENKSEYDQKDNVVLLRHDVDRFPASALSVAQMEAKLGAFGTYFFRTKPWSFDKKIIQEIAELGHEIGYHYESLADAAGDYPKAKELCEKSLHDLREITPVVSVAMHSRPLSPHDNRLFWHQYLLSDFDLKGEAYISVDHRQFMYVADSGRNWNADRLVVYDKVEGLQPPVMARGTDGFIEKIQSGEFKKMQILIHPHRWPTTRWGWINQWLADGMINSAKIGINAVRQICAKLKKTNPEDEGQLYGKKDPVGSFLSSWRRKVVLPLIRGALVDLSCGDNLLVSAYGSGTGVDVMDHGKVDQVVEDYRELPFEDHSVDTVTIIASLNYFDHPQEALEEIKRILKSDGQLIVTLTNDKALSVWHQLRDSKGSKGAIRQEELEVLLGQAGFRVQETRTFMLFLNKAYIAIKR